MGNGCTSQKAVQTVQAPSLPPLKIVFVGESAVGKTSLIERYRKNHFLNKDYEPTKIVNIVSVVKKVNVPDQGIATLELWDTPGHEDVNIRKTHYLNADAVVVVFDISDPDSLDGALDWKRDIAANIRHTHASRNSSAKCDESDVKSSSEQYKPKPGSVPVLLLGNKFDVAKENYLREQYATYDMLGSKVTFNPLVKTSSDEIETKNPDTDSPPKPDNTTPDSDADQGIIADNNEEDKEKQPVQEKQEGNGEEDQGIVADKEDTPSNKSDPSDKEEAPDKPSKELEPTKSTDTATTDSSGVEVDEVREDQNDVDNRVAEGAVNIQNAVSRVKKMSVDSGVINNSEDGSKTEEEQVNKTKKLKKIFPKDLAKQEEKVEESKEDQQESKPVEKLQETESAPTLDNSETTEQMPAVAEGSIITNLSVLPPCVDVLENFTEEHGFISGIPVSAKDAKGGVHEALQSLVRHLVAKRKENGSTRRQRIDEMSVKSHASTGRTRRRQHPRKPGSAGLDFEPLQEVGIIEIDESLRKCNPVLRKAETLTTAYREAIHDFKRTCYKHHLVAGGNISIEECVSAVKEAVLAPPKASNEKSEIRAALLMQEYRPSFSLVAEDEDNFIKLNVIDGNGEVIDLEEVQETITFSKEARLALLVYHEKVFSSCTSILESGFELEQILSQFCDQLSGKEEKAWDMAVAAGRSQTTVRHILAGLAQDRARLRGTLEQVKETRRSVNAIRARIRAALLF